MVELRAVAKNERTTTPSRPRSVTFMTLLLDQNPQPCEDRRSEPSTWVVRLTCSLLAGCVVVWMSKDNQTRSKQ